MIFFKFLCRTYLGIQPSVEMTWKMKNVLIAISLIVATSSAKQTFKIAGIVSTDQIGRALEDAVRVANQNMPSIVQLQALYIKMDANPIRSALNLCSDVISKGVHTVIVSKPENSDVSPPISVSYTCGFYSIPVIGISARDSSFSDMVRNVVFLTLISLKENDITGSYSQNVEVHLVLYVNDEVLMHVVTHGMCIKI